MQKKQIDQVFRDPVFGYINISYEIITEIIDTSVFQRLRRIRQLSGVSMVFHGAEHSRFSHSLGVYEVANRFISKTELKTILNEREKLLVLISALLHDIGHGPYSHAFEDVFNVDHELIGARIITENKQLRVILNKIDFNFAEDVASIITKKGKYPLLEQLISSQLDADRLDYLVRDAYYTGVTYGAVDLDRIIRSLRIIDNKIVFKVSGIHAIENYLISRYHMYWQVYYHNVSRAYEVVLEKIYLRIKDLLKTDYKFSSNLEPLKQIINDPNNLEHFLLIDDFYINGLIASFLNSSDQILKILSNDFINRKIWNYIPDNEFNKERINEIKEGLTEEQLKYFKASKTVYETTYKDTNENFGEHIYILLENNTIKTLKEESKIIESLSQSGNKSVPMFFYRDKNEEA